MECLSRFDSVTWNTTKDNKMPGQYPKKRATKKKKKKTVKKAPAKPKNMGNQKKAY